MPDLTGRSPQPEKKTPVRLDRFTERSQEALQAAQQSALSLRHPTVDPEHLLLALIEQPDGLVATMLRRLEVQPEAIAARLRAGLDARPRQLGAGPRRSRRRLRRPPVLG